ncbi:MAG: 5-methyltetrahydropteroyltriglutamate--homocysteine S-methyltransferase, partial [Lachnospiraceae bacterium]|nr:5-methyltetrahydropteroyltriglutamate--homocysteine S-methyltransferase [Lachnospiraceae bacterium]
MQTSVIGFPRIGTLRELKFVSEKYFRKEIGEAELLEAAKKLRRTHWSTQKNAGIDYISSNDFSYYDMLLDTAALFGIIPKRYQELHLSKLDTYFAMARGYQGASGDVKALAMKKWFNTNYHYIVPELEDDTVISLVGNKPFTEYAEAKALGIETKPVVIGAYTLLKLCRCTGKKKTEDYMDDIIRGYQELIQKCEEYQIAWLQLDEPALVQDMDREDIARFHTIYEAILPSAKQCHVLLQTYFGDVRDIYQNLIKMPFTAIGLDFIEGKETYHLIEKYGFPQDKILFAGLVNGKNVWKNHYKNTLQTLDDLRRKGIRTVLSTSCSLLHVPYTLSHEKKLSAEYLSHFSFAEEKLAELAELNALAECSDYSGNAVYQNNEKLFSESR